MIDKNKIIKNFMNNNMECLFVERNELFSTLDTLLTIDCTTGSGDSVTLEELEVFDFLRNKTNFNDKHQPDLNKETKRKIYLQNFNVDYFFTGSNAITENGEIFNIDGNGSRVAPMLYGPAKVIVIVGINKIVKNVKEAIERSRQIAAVKDAKRLHKKTPCTKLDSCIDCSSKERICNDFVLIAGQFDKERIKIIIVNEKLGY